MATNLIALDDELLQAVDRVAHSENIDRAEWISRLLQDELKRRSIREMEDQHRRAYLAVPQAEDEYMPWIEAQACPED